MGNVGLTVKGFIVIDGKDVPWESLPEKERAERIEAMAKRAGEELSRYYCNRPKEFARLKKTAEKMGD